MNVLILNTVARQNGLQRETPLAWFADGEDTDRQYPVIRLTRR